MFFNDGADKMVDNGGADKMVDNGGADKMVNNGGADKMVDNDGIGKMVDNGGADKMADNDGIGKMVDNGGADKMVDNDGADKIITKKARKAEEKAKAEAERKAKMEAERKANAEAREAERKALEAERKANAEARKALEAERKANADAREAERKANADAREAERKANADAREAERKAKAEAKEAERKAKEDEENANKYIGFPLDIVNDEIKQQFEKIAFFAFSVAKGLGKGRVEGVYQNALCQELQLGGINYQTEETLSIRYKGRIIGQERLDIHIYGPDAPMILELKATSSDIKPDEQWQVISYMRSIGCNFGAVINFNQSPTKSLQIDYIVLCNDKAYVYDINNGLTVGEPMNNY